MSRANIESASVKVMRSYDYCHFEVTLAVSLSEIEGNRDDKIAVVDDLRKDAARLADKAVEQYKIAKSCAAKWEYQSQSNAERKARLTKLAEIIQSVPERERTPEENGILKGIADEQYARRQYDYQDDFYEENH
jgi:hypothetical protein